MKSWMVFALCMTVGAFSFAQDSGTIQTDEDSLFGSSAVPGDSAPVTDATSPVQSDSPVSSGTDEDSLFGGDLVTEAKQTEADLGTSLLVSDGVQIGGRYSFSMAASAGWTDASTLFENLTDPDTQSMTTDLSARLYFDARPDENFRVFGKMTVSYPFATDTDRALQDVFHVEELFSDFNWNNTVFFRGGKQTMNWGVGYFYSPADLLSIAEIDPENPDAEREGPIALKANVPIGVDNLYFYVLPANITDPEPLDTGVAAKADIVLGPGEITTGAIYQRDIAPAGMITASYSLGDFDLFGEGVLSYGSNRTFVVEDTSPLGVTTAQKTDSFFVNATTGFRYSYSFEGSNSTFLLAAQYLYNGEGYSDPSIIQDHQAGVAFLLGNNDLSTSDLANRGVHYTALNASLSRVFDSDANLSVFWMQNYTDGSAMVTPSVSLDLFDYLNVSLKVPLQIGDEGAELSPLGTSASVSLTATLGGGSF